MTKTAHYLIAICLLFAVAVPLQAWRDRGWQAYQPPTPVQWLRAGPAARRLALGFDNVLARKPRLGRALRGLTYTLERTWLQRLGLSHLLVLERTGSGENASAGASKSGTGEA